MAAAPTMIMTICGNWLSRTWTYSHQGIVPNRYQICMKSIFEHDTDIHNNNVPSLGLEQQHEELCYNTPRGVRMLRISINGN